MILKEEKNIYVYIFNINFMCDKVKQFSIEIYFITIIILLKIYSKFIVNWTSLICNYLEIQEGVKFPVNEKPFTFLFLE